MADSVNIDVQNINELLRNLEKADKTVRQSAFKGLQMGAMAVINDAKENLRQNTPPNIVTGLLRASGKVQKVEDETLDMGFFDTTNQGHGYASYVEYGRRSGKFPPLDAIEEWAKKKLGIKDEREARTVGFLIARRIAREGSTPHPFFIPAIKKNSRGILQAMKDAIATVTR